MLALLVFIVTVIIDILWVWMLRAVEDDYIEQASVLSMGSAALAGFSTVVYVADPWLLIPEIIGNGVGTALAMCIKRVVEMEEMLLGKA